MIERVKHDPEELVKRLADVLRLVLSLWLGHDEFQQEGKPCDCYICEVLDSIPLELR